MWRALIQAHHSKNVVSQSESSMKITLATIAVSTDFYSKETLAFMLFDKTMDRLNDDRQEKQKEEVEKTLCGWEG